MKVFLTLFILFYWLDNLTLSQTVLIGTQVWSSKNLNVSTFRNGDKIPEVKNKEEWVKAGENKQPAWCYYDNDPNKGTKFGKLYNWYAVNDPRGLAPVGFHIPTDEDWTILTDFLGGNSNAGKKLKSVSDWKENSKDYNSSGFSGLPSGYRHYFGYFQNINERSNWWSSSEDGGSYAWIRLMKYDYYGNFIVEKVSNYKGEGMPVRCIKD